MDGPQLAGRTMISGGHDTASWIMLTPPHSASVSLGRFTLSNNGGFFGVKNVEGDRPPLKEGGNGTAKAEMS